MPHRIRHLDAAYLPQSYGDLYGEHTGKEYNPILLHRALLTLRRPELLKCKRVSVNLSSRLARPNRLTIAHVLMHPLHGSAGSMSVAISSPSGEFIDGYYMAQVLRWSSYPFRVSTLIHPS